MMTTPSVLSGRRITSDLSCRQIGSYDRTERRTTRVRYTLQREPFADSSRNFIVHSYRMAGIRQGRMPRPWEMKDKFDLITADFTYVRWLRDRKGIEEQTTTWDKV